MPEQMLKFRTMSLLIFCARRKYDSLLLLLFIADLVWNLVLKLCLMSCRLELSHWSMPALLLHERIAFPRSHYHMGNLESFFFFFNGPESCMLELQNMSYSPHPPSAPKKTANDDRPFENCNVTTVRVKVKCRNPPFCKMNRHHGMKACRRKEG